MHSVWDDEEMMYNAAARAERVALFFWYWLMNEPDAVASDVTMESSVEGLRVTPLAESDEGAEVQAKQRGGLRVASFAKPLLFLTSLFLFILAIILMKEGAKALAPYLRNSFVVHNAANSMGFGWLFAYVVMSGSPVAAAALTFFDAGIINQLQTFTMITGSRLGASFIVLFIGFVYVLRGRNRASSLSMGLLALNVSGFLHILGLFVGLALLWSGRLDRFYSSTGYGLRSLIEVIFDPIASLFINNLPQWALFPVGLLIIIVSFNLFDRCLPEMTLKESELGRMSRMIYKPWVMFLLGAAITTISMSVSISIGILVPLSQRGFVRRENVIPYIMGADITTFIDTLIAAILLGNPAAFTVVLAEMLSVAIVSILVLSLSYNRFERGMLRYVSWITEKNWHLAIFMIVIFAVPIFLLFV